MALRLVHTSDWHLGHVLHDVDRAPEQRAFLAWLADLCEREGAHGLLVAGDLFDVASPPAAAVGMLAEFLVDVWRRLPQLTVVAIGGNHDSPHRLETTEPFLRALGRLHVVGAAPRGPAGLEPERALVRIEGGGESALVAAIPFLRAADLRAEDLGADPAAPVRRVHDAVFGAARARRRPGEALVAMGHLFVVGGASGASERTLVGGAGAVPSDAFPPDVAYGALGHLHRPQAIGARLRYSGAPLPLSFDEAQHEQQVVVVDLAGGALVAARAVPTPRPRPLLRVPADGPAPLAEVLEQLRALPPLGDLSPERVPLLEARVRLARPEPALRARLDEAVEGRAARLVRWQVVLDGDGAALGDGSPAATLDELDPVDVFRRRWASRFGGEPTAELLGAFDELLAEARGEAAP